ncbi:MAG TPA: hypothetical protein GX534_03275 [Thermoanaerobacterales bacterium]|nr:hypothetical protein [Thermoanaerobacterales bacterium]
MKKYLNPERDYTDLFLLFDSEEIKEDEIARDMNLELQTVRSIKKQWYDSEKDEMF